MKRRAMHAQAVSRQPDGRKAAPGYCLGQRGGQLHGSHWPRYVLVHSRHVFAAFADRALQFRAAAELHRFCVHTLSCRGTDLKPFSGAPSMSISVDLA